MQEYCHTYPTSVLENLRSNGCPSLCHNTPFVMLRGAHLAGSCQTYFQFILTILTWSAALEVGRCQMKLLIHFPCIKQVAWNISQQCASFLRSQRYICIAKRSLLGWLLLPKKESQNTFQPFVHEVMPSMNEDASGSLRDPPLVLNNSLRHLRSVDHTFVCCNAPTHHMPCWEEPTCIWLALAKSKANSFQPIWYGVMP